MICTHENSDTCIAKPFVDTTKIVDVRLNKTYDNFTLNMRLAVGSNDKIVELDYDTF